MSKLSFRTQFRSYELNSLDMPVEVRKRDMTLVMRTLSSQTIDLEPGVYYVIAKMPAGQELCSRIELKPDSSETVVLQPEVEDETPHEWHGVQHFLERSAGSVRMRDLEMSEVTMTNGEDAAEEDTAEMETASETRLRLFTGNVLNGNYQSESEPFGYVQKFNQPEVNEVLRVQYSGDMRVYGLQLAQVGLPAMNVMLPATPHQQCLIIVRRNEDATSARYALDIHLTNLTADTLLRYLSLGYLQQASLAVDSQALSAQNLLMTKMQDPVAAAVGAYALLRFNELKRLYDWTENLKNYFDWLPDGAALRGEHLARTGEHAKAIEAFLQLTERGLPIFTDGFSFALDRLRLYLQVKESPFSPDQLKQAKWLFERLSAFTPFVDFTQPMLTYTGIKPDEPGNQPLSHEDASWGMRVE
jgi:hypothetical protein